MQQGVQLFLRRILQDLQARGRWPPHGRGTRAARPGAWITACRAPQASDGELHLQALQALHSLGRGGKASAAHSLPVEDVQTAFGRGGGLPLLVGLLDTAVTPKPGAAAQPAAVTQRAVGALTAMTRNHAANRRADRGTAQAFS